MNVREGFARLARVTAVAYGLVALVAVWSTYNSTLEYGGDYARAFKAAGEMLFGFAVFYAVAWAVFRALRWVARGFLERPV